MMNAEAVATKYAEGFVEEAMKAGMAVEDIQQLMRVASRQHQREKHAEAFDEAYHDEMNKAADITPARFMKMWSSFGGKADDIGRWASGNNTRFRNAPMHELESMFGGDTNMINAYRSLAGTNVPVPHAGLADAAAGGGRAAGGGGGGGGRAGRGKNPTGDYSGAAAFVRGRSGGGGGGGGRFPGTPTSMGGGGGGGGRAGMLASLLGKGKGGFPWWRAAALGGGVGLAGLGASTAIDELGELRAPNNEIQGKLNAYAEYLMGLPDGHPLKRRMGSLLERAKYDMLREQQMQLTGVALPGYDQVHRTASGLQPIR
jgi:hypothetical protein